PTRTAATTGCSPWRPTATAGTTTTTPTRAARPTASTAGGSWTSPTSPSAACSWPAWSATWCRAGGPHREGAPIEGPDGGRQRIKGRATHPAIRTGDPVMVIDPRLLSTEESPHRGRRVSCLSHRASGAEVDRDFAHLPNDA